VSKQPKSRWICFPVIEMFESSRTKPEKAEENYISSDKMGVFLVLLLPFLSSCDPQGFEHLYA